MLRVQLILIVNLVTLPYKATHAHAHVLGCNSLSNSNIAQRGSRSNLKSASAWKWDVVYGRANYVHASEFLNGRSAVWGLEEMIHIVVAHPLEPWLHAEKRGALDRAKRGCTAGEREMLINCR